MSFGYGFGLPSWQTLSGGFNPSSLFVGGTQGVWYDPSDASTLFSDTAGTTPSPTPGAGALSVVGAMLDKRAPSYSVFFDGTGDYFTTPDSTAYTLGSGDFTFECWINNNTTGARKFICGQSNNVGADASGAVNLQKTAGNKLSATVIQATTFTAYVATSTADLPLNTWTHIAFVRNGNTGTLYINGTADGTVNLTGVTVNDSSNLMGVGSLGEFTGTSWQGYISNFRLVKGTAVYTANFTPPTSPLSAISGTSLLTCGTSWTGNPAITVNGDCKVDQSNPFVASPLGNHAISYNTTTARPELSARVNLLTYSEQFDNAVWSKFNTTVTANATTAPDGTLTADKLVEAAVTDAHSTYYSLSPAGLSFTYSFYAKAAERTWAKTRGFAADCYFDLANGVLGSVAGGVTASITAVGNGWYRCSVTASTGLSNVQIGVTTGNGVDSYLGVAGNGIFIWGADLRPANIGTSVPAYQRIADQYTYDSSGFPRYLVFNGVASGMYTPASIPFATVTSDGQARRNLLNNPTQFDVTASWTQTAVTVTANTAVAPDGTTSGDTIQLGAGTSTKWIGQLVSAFAGARTYSFYAKYSTNRYIQFLNNGSTQAWANFDILNGVAGTAGSGVTSSITDAGNGWWRCVITHSIAAATEFRVYGADSNSAAWDASTTSTGAYFLWGAQLETGSTATAFQNIGTDKATVFAGVRKQAAGTGQVVELSASVPANNGTFSMPSDSGTGNWGTASKGTNPLVLAESATNSYVAPISTVNTGIHNLALSSNVATLRVNGSQVAVSGAGAGGGNFGTYPLYIGSRNTASLWFNGYLYSLIVVGAASTAAQITSTESWINGKEGGVY